MNSLPKNFHVDMPEELAREVASVEDEFVVDVGVAWALKQAEELMSANVPCVHFYIMQSADVVLRVAEPLRMMA